MAGDLSPLNIGGDLAPSFGGRKKKISRPKFSNYLSLGK